MSKESEDFSCFVFDYGDYFGLLYSPLFWFFAVIWLCCITAGVCKVFRLCCSRLNSDHRQNNNEQAADQFILNMTLQEQHTGLPLLRGMSAFEWNALRSVVFSKQLLQEWAEEGQRSSSSCDSSTAAPPPPQSESSEEKMMTNYSSCECSICLCSIEEGQKCRRLPLPCGHLFHLPCIDEWLKQSVHCPLCKRSAMHLLMRTDPMVASSAMGSGDINVRNHRRFLQLIRLAEDSDVEQLVRFSAHPEGRLNPYFAGGVAATTTGYHTIIDDMAPNEEYVHSYRRNVLEAALVASSDDNESRSSSSV